MNSINHLVTTSLENFNCNGKNKNKGNCFVDFNCCFVTGGGNQIFISGCGISDGTKLLSLLRGELK